MADELPEAADVRAVLREHGEAVNDRGRLSPEEKAAYKRIQDGAPPPDYDGGVTEADFPDEPAGVAPVPEQKPRRVRATRPSLTDRLRGSQGKPKGKTGAKRKHPRVPVDRVVGLVWEALGRMFTPISPPVGRCLQLQAPVAGLVLEDVVRDTVVDKVLQPVARAEEKGKKVLAVAAPPMLVLAIEQANAIADEGARNARLAFLVPMLRESLMLWGDVAGDKLIEQQERIQKRGPAYAEADRLMNLIFGQVADGQVAPDPADDAAARAQQMAGV